MPLGIAGWCDPDWRATTPRPHTWHLYRAGRLPMSGCGRWQWDASTDHSPKASPPEGAVVCKVCAQVAAKATPAPDLLASLADAPPPQGEPRLNPWRLRLARGLRGLTQAQLAAAAGYKGGATRLCRIERWTDEDAGIKHGRPVAFRWAKALRLTADDLCSDDATIAADRAQHDAWRASDLPLREWAQRQRGKE